MDSEVLTSMPDLCAPDCEAAHVRIARWLSDTIGAGRLSAGDRLPPEGDLAAALGCSRMTLRQALGELESRGLVDRRRGRGGGTFVARPRIEVDLTGLPGFTEQMRRVQVRPGASLVEAARMAPGAEVAEALGLRRGDDAFRIVRVRSANREPLALEETYLPAEHFPGLLDRSLTGSLYELMERDYDLAPFMAREWLEPVVADDACTRLLGVGPGTPLMLVTRTAYTAAGRPIEHAKDRYRADRSRITVQTEIGHRAAPLRGGR